MPLIIFVTAFERHALEAFEVDAVDYLLKPVRRERLEKAIEKARRQMKPRRHRTGREKIVGRRGGDLYLLDPSDIIGFQAEGELVHVIYPTAALSERPFAQVARREAGAAALPPHSSAHHH